MPSMRSALGLALAAGLIVPLAAISPATAAGKNPDPPAAPDPVHYEWSNAAISGGGYVPGIIYNATQEGLVYARTDIGGAYRLNRADDEWVPLLDHVGWDEWNRLGVLSLATDPVEPERVYVATGMYTNDWDPHNGAILRPSCAIAAARLIRVPRQSSQGHPWAPWGVVMLIAVASF